jgi:hypothetical protein
MRGTTVAKAGIAISLFWIALVACTTQAPRGYRTSILDLDTGLPTKGQVCMVSDESCLSMMTEPPHTCPAFLTTTEPCNTKGRSLDVTVDQRHELTLDSGH